MRLKLLPLLFLIACSTSKQEPLLDVLVLGGGTGGTAAAIAAARSGASVILIEETPWLGGMLTAAGVSAIDGNHHMPAGIWGEFREKLREHYGGPDALATGWVSHSLFEPKVGAQIFESLVQQEANLEVALSSSWEPSSISWEQDRWLVEASIGGQAKVLQARVLIDGTDLGDVAAAAGCSFEYGMDARDMTGESMAPQEANTIIQDFTYTAILKDFGEKSTDHWLVEPVGYDRDQFLCACEMFCDESDLTVHPCETMLKYARLPNDKYLINWPLHGNDYYADLVAISEDERAKAYEAAKRKTIEFVYYIQQELGFQHLGLADDEFDSPDFLPYIPYHREGRRIVGHVQITANEILQPYSNGLYRTGIAVGDYPIDHHHHEKEDAPAIEFPAVPSFSIPLGALIPIDQANLLMADKAIWTSNIANGSTRLQPVVLQIGTASGIVGALAALQKTSVDQVSVRSVQEEILKRKGYLIPSYDVSPGRADFVAMQRTAAAGILRGEGEPYQWANRTWYYPDEPISRFELTSVWSEVDPDVAVMEDDGLTYFDDLRQLLAALSVSVSIDGNIAPDRPLTRGEIASILDRHLDLFARYPVDIYGDPPLP